MAEEELVRPEEDEDAEASASEAERPPLWPGVRELLGPRLRPQEAPPGREDPEAETPSAETPSAETPSAETPSAETPSVETPSAETPSRVAEEAAPGAAETELLRAPEGGLEHSLAPGERDAPPREPLDDYEELEVIGTGGVGVVTRARDRASGELVAIKRLRKPIDRLRFLHEAEAIASLDHPGIVRLRRVIGGEDPAERLALVLELVEGPDLERLVRREGRLGLDQALELAIQLSEALGHAHARGLIHRDVKPSNVLLGPDGRARLSDFGLALALEAQLSMTPSGVALGTPNYMAPEQLEGAHRVDARADVYGLGATLYRLVTGRSPRVVRERYLPAEVADLVLRCLEESPLDRFPDMASLREALEGARERVRRDASGVHAPLERAVERVQRELDAGERRQVGRRLIAAVVGLSNLELLPLEASARLRSRLELGEPWPGLLDELVEEVLATASSHGQRRSRLLRDAHAILSASLASQPAARRAIRRLGELAREVVRDPPGTRLSRVVERLAREGALEPGDLRLLSSRSGPARVVLEGVLTRLRVRAEAEEDALWGARRARAALREIAITLPEWASRIEEEDLGFALREAAERAARERPREEGAAAGEEDLADQDPHEAD